MRPNHHHPDLRNHTNNAALETVISPMTSQNWYSGRPNSDGSGTFMPNRPVITVSGPNNAAITAMTFEPSASRFDTVARCASLSIRWWAPCLAFGCV